MLYWRVKISGQQEWGKQEGEAGKKGKQILATHNFIRKHSWLLSFQKRHREIPSSEKYVETREGE